MTDNVYHTPVLYHEVLAGLAINPDGVYVDCTFGGGGHSRGVLEKLSENGRLIAFDQDADVTKNIPNDERVLFVPHNFRYLQRFLRFHKTGAVDGVLADLGVSSFQFDNAMRGFSTRFEGPMDMRMNQQQTQTAADIISTYTEDALHHLFEKYGEITNAKTLSKHIVMLRSQQQIKTLVQFKNVISPVVRGNPNKYFAQVFQALRIEVNDELVALKELLEQLPSVLKQNGRAVLITFHSLEDRLVKTFFKQGQFDNIANDDIFFNSKKESVWQVLTKKPITASEVELQQNPRSRSAKLRVAIKL